MHDLFQLGHLEGFKEWLKDEDLVIRAYAALCISNLARTDAHCIAMVKGGLAPSIVDLLRREDPKEKNSALSCLRNLSLASTAIFPSFFLLSNVSFIFLLLLFVDTTSGQRHGQDTLLLNLK